MYVYQADKIADFEEEKARVLRDIITSKVQKNFADIQAYYGLEDEAEGVGRALLTAPPARDPENPYLVERRKAKPGSGPDNEKRRKTDHSSPMRGKY